MKFSFGGLQREKIEVDVLRYEREACGDIWDDNWLEVNANVWAGGFRGKISATFQTGELESFCSELRTISEAGKRMAKFETLEGQLRLRLAGDGKGHFEVEGEIQDQPGIGNTLHFTFSIDQTQLKYSISELECVVSHFPFKGSRTDPSTSSR